MPVKSFCPLVRRLDSCWIAASTLRPLLFATGYVAVAFGNSEPAWAQQRAAVARSPASSTALPDKAIGGKQWEYLIVSFGKTTFRDPDREPESKQLGFSKLLTYSQAGVLSASEAMGTQHDMDVLGKFGWELVGVVGAIGGDQEMVFKRMFDPAQSKREAQLIRREGKLLIAEEKATAARLAKATQEPSDDLVNLDEVEKAAATEGNRRREQTRLADAISGTIAYPALDLKAISTAPDPNGSRIEALVTIDGTQALLKDRNRYRASEAQKLAKDAALAYYSAAGLKQEYSASNPTVGFYGADVKISVTVSVTYHGAPHEVAVENVGGYWPDKNFEN